MYNRLNSYLNQQTSSSSLSIYRFFFGLLMSASIFRFWWKGWIEEIYITPSFFFSYYGFEWIKPLGEYTYVVFFICFISSLFVCVGFKYRFSIIIFFLSFTYIELMDKTTYLNHYYLISSLSFLMIFLPANASFSLDNLINKKNYLTIPKWTVDVIKLFISIVYIYASISKMNSDWLFNAMPLKIWISSKYHFSFVGEALFQKEWIYYLMSWGGMLYDFFIPFLLLYSRTRLFAFLMVIVFHMLTKILFPIGMFPYIMIFSAIIFFSPKFHNKIMLKMVGALQIVSSYFSHIKNILKNTSLEHYRYTYQKIVLFFVIIFFLFHLLTPFRYIFYPGELFWHEQGYRFSWRVMLTEKTALTNFRIFNPEDSTSFYVQNSDFLTPFQEKQMSFQPDFILEFAHYLGDYFYETEGVQVEVFVDSYVSLNGRKSKKFIDSSVNLYLEEESFKNKNWILPFEDEIKGF